MRVLAAWMLCLVGCAGDRRFAVQLDFVPNVSPSEVQIRALADDRSVDVARARAILERYLELPTGEDALGRTEPTLDLLPAPAGAAWVALDDSIALESAVSTRLGRLVLAKTGDGQDVTLDDVRSVTRAGGLGGTGDSDGAEGFALRLALRPERSAAFERLCASAAGGVLLFVAHGRVELAVRVGDGLPSRSGDVVIAGLAREQADLLIRGGARPPR